MLQCSLIYALPLISLKENKDYHHQNHTKEGVILHGLINTMLPFCSIKYCKKFIFTSNNIVMTRKKPISL